MRCRQQAQTPIKFTLDWVFQGPTSPFLVALEKGYYKAEGLDVTMDPGQGSAGAVQRVATGAYQIGFADVNSTIEYNAKNPGKEVLCVFMAYDFAPFGVYALKKSGIKVPKDLEGKKLGAPVFDASFRLFPAFAKMNGITKWEHVNLTPQLREQSLVQGTVDFISGHYFSSMLDLKARGVKFDDIVAMRYVDFGMDVYGNGIVISPEMAKNEKAVKGFIAATIKGWKDVIADNKLGIAAAKKKRSADRRGAGDRAAADLAADQHPDALRQGQRHGRRRSGALRAGRSSWCPRPSACRRRRRPTRSSPTSTCRPRPTGWSRSDGRLAFVDLKAVSLTYRLGKETTLALADATFGIDKGEFIAVVGPSGCGKSTIMKLVTGLLPATERRGAGGGREGDAGRSRASAWRSRTRP